MANRSDAWVARAPLADTLEQYLAGPEAMSGRQLAAAAEVDPKMLRKVLHGDADWTTLTTAEALLTAAGLGELLDEQIAVLVAA